MNLNRSFIVAIFTQLVILAFALYEGWDPFLVFFVYTTELIFAAMLGLFNSVRFGGLKQLPLQLFFLIIISGFAFGLIFASANILLPFGIQPVSKKFGAIIYISTSQTWRMLLINFLSLVVTATKQKNSIDPFFYTLKPLVHLIPLTFVILLGGFIALLGWQSAIIITMTIAHILGDFLINKNPH